MLIIPSSHAQPHLFDFILPRKLSRSIEIKALIDVLPSFEFKEQQVTDIGKIAGEICEYYGHTNNHMNVRLIELEEGRKGFQESSLLSKLDTARFIVRYLGKSSQDIEDDLLIGGKELNNPCPGLKAVTLKKDFV